MNAAQAAALLGVSPRAVYDLAAPGGPIPCVRIGRRVVFEEADVLEFKATCRSTETARPAPAPAPLPSEPLPSDAMKSYFGLERIVVEPLPPARRSPAETRKLRRQEQRREEERQRALRQFSDNKRRASLLNRTPPWADLEAMRAIYAEAQRRTRETGIPHHVDHEIPLQGERVSGLHVANNLQILPGSENSRKKNRFEV